jgi:large subunit ribosomal protein L18
MKSWKRIRLRTKRRKMRNRNRVRGDAARPRLTVYRSNRHIYAQIIDDVKGETLAASSSLLLERGGKLSARHPGNREAAKEVGLDLAARASEGAGGISEVRFDRGAYKYHGRVMALAEGAREGGLVF